MAMIVVVVLSTREPATIRNASRPKILPLRWRMLFRVGFRLILIGGEKEYVHNLGTLRGSNIQHWYDVHDETPFFVPKEAHEKDKADRRSNKRSDTGCVIETVWDEYICDHKEARKEC